ncbi:MAG: hypothetical protein IJ588_02210 [Prevotella sp.]|nr:hypothetical protein [Prevotella sp.]
MIYGQEIPALTYTAPGLVGNDANADLTVANSITGMTAGLQIAVSDQQTDAVSQKLKVKEGGYTIAVTGPTTANNCNYTFAVVNSTLTVNKATLKVKVKNEEVTFGDNLPTTYDFEYVSGLTTAAEINEYVANGVIANSQQNSIFNNNSNPQFAYNPENPVNQGTYTVTGSGLASDNYKILYTTGTLKINQANIADANITVNEQYTQNNQQVYYTYLGGDAIKPDLTTNVDAANYEVVYKNNTKAYTLTGQEAFTHQVNNETVAYTEDELAELGFPYVVITGKKNYTGTKKIAFGIKKANLTITAKADPIKVGETPVYSATIEGLLENNAEEIKTKLLAKQAVTDFEGTLTYACLGGNDAGSFTITPSGLTATNYNIDWQNGTLTVNPGTLPLKVKTTAGTYGTAVTAALNFDYEFDTDDEAYASLGDDVKNGLKTLVEPANVTWTVKKNGEVVNPVNNEWKLAVGTDYTVEASATDPNYTITFDPASLTVNKKALTITIVPQTAALFDNEGNKKSIYTDGSVKLDAVFYDSQTNTTEYNPTNAQNGYTVKVEGLQGNDQIGDLNITGLTSSVETVGVHTGAITLVVSSENGNYDYTNAGGTLTITGPSLDLIYAANEDNDAKIKNYDGATGVTVNLTRDIRTGYAEKWFAMVLPFNATLTELCTAFGCYVVVNTLDKANADASKVKFALQMQGITANEPFLIKFNSAVTGTAQTPKQFANRTISYKATPEAHDNAGNYFYGTFKQKTLNEEEDVEVGSKIWTVSPAKDKFVRLGANKTPVNPLIGWLETATALDAFAPAIFVQDIDGTVTAINAVATDAPAVSAEGWYNLNGVKMQGVPTEKGVYIQNGKKVIIK